MTILLQGTTTVYLFKEYRNKYIKFMFLIEYSQGTERVGRRDIFSKIEKEQTEGKKVGDSSRVETV